MILTYKLSLDNDNVIQGYIARDSDGDLYFYENMPIRQGRYWYPGEGFFTSLHHPLYIGDKPEIRWEDEPLRASFVRETIITEDYDEE